MTTLPPLTGTPLDYPIHAPTSPITPTRFSAPIIKRAALAGAIAAAIISLAAFPVIGLAAIALGVMAASVWGGEKLADRVSDRLADSAGMWPPNPHSWWPAVVALVAIWAIVYFS
jgi:hypothetical protein